MCGEDEDITEQDDDLIVLPQRPPDAEDDLQVEVFAGDIKYTKEDEIKILVATDIHVGANEDKNKIGNDSFDTFEEVLQIAAEKNVDMILLGGDLFHKNKPSRECIMKVARLLRKYCWNDREVLLQYLSDPTVNFEHSEFASVNYEDSNINVGMPIFTIHGNHDDMAGKGFTILDHFHDIGLLNHFGKVEDISDFKIVPICLKKGRTKLCLYGIGSQRDDRLFRAFKEKAIKIMRPEEDHDKFFNIFVVHQNRAKRNHQRTTGAFLPEDFIPGFMDLVVWGHEHACKKDLEYFTHSQGSLGNGFYILQPGSTVATSICADECIPKNVFLIKVRGRLFKSTPIPLQTTRQIYMENITLDKIPSGIVLSKDGSRPPADSGKPLPDEKIIIQKINEMIEKATQERGPRQPNLPLLRLIVTYAGPWAHMQPINGSRIGARFSDKVANCQDMIVTKKAADPNKAKLERNIHAINNVLENASSDTFDDVIDAYYENLPMDENLTILDPGTIKDAINQYVDEEASKAAKANKDFSDIIAQSMQTAIDALMSLPVPKITYDENGEVKFSTFVKLVNEDMKQYKLNKYAHENTNVDATDDLNRSDDIMEEE